MALNINANKKLPPPPPWRGERSHIRIGEITPPLRVAPLHRRPLSATTSWPFPAREHQSAQPAAALPLHRHHHLRAAVVGIIAPVSATREQVRGQGPSSSSYSRGLLSRIAEANRAAPNERSNRVSRVSAVTAFAVHGSRYYIYFRTRRGNSLPRRRPLVFFFVSPFITPFCVFGYIHLSLLFPRE